MTITQRSRCERDLIYTLVLPHIKEKCTQQKPDEHSNLGTANTTVTDMTVNSFVFCSGKRELRKPVFVCPQRREAVCLSSSKPASGHGIRRAELLSPGIYPNDSISTSGCRNGSRSSLLPKTASSHRAGTRLVRRVPNGEVAVEG